MKKYIKSLCLTPVIFIIVNAFLAQNLKVEWFTNHEKNNFNYLNILLILSSLVLIFQNKKDEGGRAWYILGVILISLSFITLYFNNISIGF